MGATSRRASSAVACIALCVLLLAAAPAAAAPAGPIQWRSQSQLASPPSGWARLLRLRNGDWLAAYATYAADPVAARFQIARSTDDARTWQVVSTLAEPGRKLDNAFLHQLPSGAVLLAGRSVIDGQSYRLPVYRSTDNGTTWTSSPISIVDRNENPNGATNRGLWEPFLFQLPDGRLSVLYSDETVPGHSQVIAQRISNDGGVTWGAETMAVISSNPDDRPGMPGIARMADGRHILVFEVCPGARCYVHQKLSSDATTWDNTTLGPLVPDHACGPYVTALADGRLLVTSCENRVSVSDDLGATWKHLDPDPFGYGFFLSWPAIYQTGANEIAWVSNVPNSFGDVDIHHGTLSAFHDDFDDDDDAGWTRYGGSFALSGDAYRLNNASAGASGKALAGDATWTNGYVEADLTLSSPTGNAGVMARVTNPGTGADAASGYYAYLDAAGFVGVGRQNGSWTSIAQLPMSVATNRTYRLRLATVGSTIRVFVDGDLKLTATDTTFARGQVGVRSHFANATFDNVVYTETTARDRFTDGDDTGWTRYGGSHSLAGGVYDLSNSGGTGKSAWALPGRRRDLAFETDVRIAGGGGDAGVLFRATDLGTGADAMNGYYVALNDAGNAVILGSMNGSWRGIASKPLAIATGQWYHVKVVASGVNIKVYVDDMSTPKLDVVDATWTSGFVGVRAHFTSASFDNAALD